MSESDQERTTAVQAGPPRRRPRRLTDRAVLLALAAVIFGAVWGVFLLASDTPGDSSADAGFARDMSVHHAQAVEMALIVRDITQDQDLRFLATDIVLTQQAQIGQMRGWLDAWGLPPNGREPAMAWMGQPTTGLMPGMASAAEIARLRALPPAEAEILFLQLMIRHHASGRDMADAALELADRPVVRRLAESIVAGQAREIDAMQSLLQARGQRPVAINAHAHDHAANGHADASHGSTAGVVTGVLAAGPVVLGLFAAAWLVLDTAARRARADDADDAPDPIWLAVAVAGLLGSSLIHAGLTPHHLRAALAQGIFFALATVVLAAIAAGLVAQPAARWYLTGLVVSAGLIVAYALFRLIPAPGSDAVEPVDLAGIASLATESAVILASALLWRGRDQRHDRVSAGIELE